MCWKHFHGVTQRSVHRMSKRIAVTIAAPIVAVEHSMVDLVASGTVRIDKTLRMTLGIPGPVGWDRDIHTPHHCLIHDGLIVPARNTDVRMMFVVGEERQGGKTRRSGDACDSLVL